MRVPVRWQVAAAVGWGGAALLYVLAGHLSVVLLLAPVAFVLGDAAAARRKARLQALVNAAFLQLVGDGEPRFRGSEVRVLRRRARLLGLPPRLIDIRIVRSPDGHHWVVRAESHGDAADDIQWRVTRLTLEEARAALA